MMKTKILLLEDNKYDSDLIKLELNRDKSRYDIRVVENRQAYLEAIEQFKPEIILSDYNLPDINALEALELLGDNIKTIPFIMVTGELSDENAANSMMQGAWDYILKDRISRLRPAIDNALLHLQEIQEKEIATYKLEISEKRFETIFSKAPLSIGILDTLGNLILANEPFKQKFQIINTDTQNFNLKEILDHKSNELFRQLLKSKDDNWSMEFKVKNTEFEYFSWVIMHAAKVVEDTPHDEYFIVHFEDITENKIGEEKLKDAYEQVRSSKNLLKEENIYLKEELKSQQNFSEIVTNNSLMIKALRHIEKVAVTDSTILLTGETGTGKELFARAIHQNSNRNNKPFIKINCAAIPYDLIESELFGHEKGAFTGALQSRKGKFELAHTGTLFLDEIGELPIQMQPKLLRVLQEGEIEKIGATQTVKTDVRVIAATNRNLENEIKQGNFREDLYYRLNIIPIKIPALRERKDDIPLLTNYFIKKYNKKFGKDIALISNEMLKNFMSYSWPGNIRELENLIERGVILSNGKELEIETWARPSHVQDKNSFQNLTLAEFEKQYIESILEQYRWRISGKSGAAQALGLKPTTLESKMKKLGIKRP